MFRNSEIVKGPNAAVVTVAFMQTAVPDHLKGIERLSMVAGDFSHASGITRLLGVGMPHQLAAVDYVAPQNPKDKAQLSFRFRAAVYGDDVQSSRARAACRDIADFEPLEAIVTPAAIQGGVFERIHRPVEGNAVTDVILNILRDPDISNKLRKDGGEIVLTAVNVNQDKNGAKVRAEVILLGGCAGCSLSTLSTLKEIKRMLAAGMKGLSERAGQSITLESLEPRDPGKSFCILPPR